MSFEEGLILKEDVISTFLLFFIPTAGKKVAIISVITKIGIFCFHISTALSNNIKILYPKSIRSLGV